MEWTVIQVVTCAFMTGLIWVIQLIHYPSFSRISPASFSEFHHFHSRRITWIVAPVMIFELISAIALVILNPSSPMMVSNLVLLGLIWLSTFFLSVPAHNQLAQGFDEKTILRLTTTNWPRTFLWSLRLGLLVMFVGQKF